MSARSHCTLTESQQHGWQFDFGAVLTQAVALMTLEQCLVPKDSALQHARLYIDQRGACKTLPVLHKLMLPSPSLPCLPHVLCLLSHSMLGGASSGIPAVTQHVWAVSLLYVDLSIYNYWQHGETLSHV